VAPLTIFLNFIGVLFGHSEPADKHYSDIIVAPFAGMGRLDYYTPECGAESPEEKYML